MHLSMSILLNKINVYTKTSKTNQQSLMYFIHNSDNDFCAQQSKMESKHKNQQK